MFVVKAIPCDMISEELLPTSRLVTVTTRPPWSIAVTAIWDSPAERDRRSSRVPQGRLLDKLFPDSL